MKKSHVIGLVMLGAFVSFNTSAQEIKQKKQVPVKSERVEKVGKTEQSENIKVEEQSAAPQQMNSQSRPLNRVQAKQPVLRRVPAAERSELKKN